jgi:hypothetical protein
MSDMVKGSYGELESNHWDRAQHVAMSVSASSWRDCRSLPGQFADYP